MLSPEASIAYTRRDLELSVRALLASRVSIADGASTTWLAAKNKIQEDFREIQSLLTEINNLYEELDQWCRDFQEAGAWDYGDSCDAEQRWECSAIGYGCEECTLERSEPYKLAARLICDYDRLLAARMDDAMKTMELLMQSDSVIDNLLPMSLGEADISYDSLVADVNRYIDTPELSAENLRATYKMAIMEDNRLPMDDQTAENYKDICFVVDCGRPHVFDYYLNWALHVMSATLEHPALQVRALIMAIEQARAAAFARNDVMEEGSDKQ